MKKNDIEKFDENPITLIGDEWMLVTAGTEEKFNTMTASWGGMGYLWNRPVALDFIRHFLAMAKLKKVLFCSFGLTKTLDFILHFLAMAKLKKVLFCSFGLTKTFIFVRPERYTFESTEKNDTFTLSFFDKSYRKALSFCGSHSGRDRDKAAETGLTPFFTGNGTPAFGEARIVIGCRKLYGAMIGEEAFVTKEILKDFYETTGGLHKMYVGEIINIRKR